MGEVPLNKRMLIRKLNHLVLFERLLYVLVVMVSPFALREFVIYFDVGLDIYNILCRMIITYYLFFIVWSMLKLVFRYPSWVRRDFYVGFLNLLLSMYMFSVVSYFDIVGVEGVTNNIAIYVFFGLYAFRFFYDPIMKIIAKSLVGEYLEMMGVLASETKASGVYFVFAWIIGKFSQLVGYIPKRVLFDKSYIYDRESLNKGQQRIDSDIGDGRKRMSLSIIEATTRMPVRAFPNEIIDESVVEIVYKERVMLVLESSSLIYSGVNFKVDKLSNSNDSGAKVVTESDG